MVRYTGGWDGLSWRSNWPGQITRADPGHRRPLSPPSQPIPWISSPIRGSLKYLWFKVMRGGLWQGLIDLGAYRRLWLCHAFVVRRLTLFHLSVNVWWPDGGSNLRHLASLKWCCRVKYWVSGINICFYAGGARIQQADLGHRGKHMWALMDGWFEDDCMLMWWIGFWNDMRFHKS